MRKLNSYDANLIFVGASSDWKMANAADWPPIQTLAERAKPVARRPVSITSVSETSMDLKRQELVEIKQQYSQSTTFPDSD